MQEVNVKMKKIQGTSAGVLPQASSWPMVRDCIPWTAGRPLVRHVVDSAARSFAPLLLLLDRILHMSVKCILYFTCVDLQSLEVGVHAV